MVIRASPNQGSVQTQNSYQPKQTYQSTPQYNQPQPQTQQYQVVRHDNSQLRNGYHNDIKYQASNNYPVISKNGLHHVEKQSALAYLHQREYSDKLKPVKASRLSSADLSLIKRGEVKPCNVSIISLTDSSAVHHTDNLLYNKSPMKKTCEPPQRVYKLTPIIKLKCVVGEFRGKPDLDGYGVHIASFLNYNYCLAVARWLRNKYHATSYVFEDQEGYTHYHLVFGRWIYCKMAQIFLGKVRREAPNAFVVVWRNDFSISYGHGRMDIRY